MSLCLITVSSRKVERGCSAIGNNDELGLDSIRQPSWDEIRIGQVSIFLSLLILVLHFRLNNIYEVTEVTIE